jgi:hypothetical protein
MKQAKCTTKNSADAACALATVRPRRSLRWLDSLMWLAIAGVLAALLVPPKVAQVARKQPVRSDETTASTKGQPPASAPYHVYEDVPYTPAGHEFILQNEADYLNAGAPSQPTVNAPSPSDSSNAVKPSESTSDDSPRVTTGPTLNGPELGSPR